MSNLNIRDIRENDIEAVLALWAETGLSHGWHDPVGDIAFAMENNNSTILIAEKSGHLAGTVMVGHDGHWGWVYYVGVTNTWRASGLGKRLLQAAENWLRERGLKKVNLLVLNDNTKVMGYYERLGYSRFPAVSMQKIL